MSNTQQTKMLAESHSLEFKDCGGGHIQISGHGVLVNYYPESKKRTAYIVGGKSVPHCSPWDAVQLCLESGKKGLKPIKVSQNGPDFDLKPITTNPAGIKHFYQGDIPPWESSEELKLHPADEMRVQAYQLQCKADEFDAAEREAVQDNH